MPQFSHLLVRLASQPTLKSIGDDKTVCEARCRVLAGHFDKKNPKDWVDNGFWAQLNVWGQYAELMSTFFNNKDEVRLLDANLTNNPYDKQVGDDKVEISSFSIDCNLIAPHLPNMASMAYKPKLAKSETGQDHSMQSQEPERVPA